MRYVLILIMALVITGCTTVGPDYEKPVIDVPAAFNNQENAGQKTVNMAWWEQFQDPALNALIAEALGHNRDVRIAAANIEQAAAVFTQSRSTLYPKIGYGGSGTRERASETDASKLYTLIPNPRNAFQTVASASWELDLWGRVRRLSEAAQAELQATQAVWQGVVLSLVSSVATSYIQLLGLDSQLAVARQTLSVYADSLNIFETRFKFGQISEMTVAQARSQYETAAVAIPQLQSQIEQTENALSILLGRNPGAVLRTGTLEALTLPAVPAGLPSDLLTNRPDIRQAEESLIAANANIGAARALYFPTISLTGALGFSSGELSDLFEGSSRVWNYAGSLTGPIFAGGAIKSGVKQAQAMREAALWTYQKVIQSAFADVENALIAQKRLAEQVTIQERLVAANREYVRLAHLQYDGGYAPYSTVLQAEQQLFPSELNHAQTRAALLSSLVTIYKSMGGGWQPAAAAVQP